MKNKELEKTEVKKVVRGFKVFKPDWSCRPDGSFKQYECPGKFEENVELSICNQGIHFCENVADCFNYYNFNSNNKVAEVIAYGQVVREGDKSCTDKLEIVREIPWDEVLRIVNTGKDCTGFCNTGNSNTGNSNTGDRNTGNSNTGDRNTGNSNTGDSNTGDRNTGDRNTGNRNTGDRNTGFCNTGNSNTGDRNTGNRNTGFCNTGNSNTGDWNTGNRNTGFCNTGNSNTGDCNTGNSNTGDRNTGNSNTGDRNTGDRNTGDRNTGNRNTGNRNTGFCNTGNSNTGDRNTGNRNTGDWNKSSFNNGCFMTEEPKIMIFNKPSDWNYSQWLESDAHYLLNRIPKNVVEWIEISDMADEEKAANPSFEATGGYLKVLDESACGQLWWDGLGERSRDIIRSMPNFDADIFEEITGIKTE